MRIAILCLSFLCASVCLADPDHVTIDLKRNWQPMVYGAGPQRAPADVVSIDLKGDLPKFCSYDTNKRGNFDYRLHLPISATNYPILVMRYRATNLDTESAEAGLLVDVDEKANIHMRPVAELNKFVADGKDQELRVDLREQKIPLVSRIMLQLIATEKQTATIELIDLRFEADADAQHVDYADEQPITITVVDKDDKPVKGAKVSVDAERKDAARSATTDASGKATITPLANETKRHMIELSADNMAPQCVLFGEDESGQNSGSRVQLVPGVMYGGFIQDEKGKPIEGATVRVFAPPPDNQQTPDGMIRRAVVRTDKQGRWQSPMMPDDGKEAMFKLAHQDFVCDAEYNATPLPPVDELKSGIGVMVMKKQ
jgi:hypothetical protein